MDVFVRPALESDIEKIKPYIDEYGLDNENLDYKQFYVAEAVSTQNNLAGFGRIKQYGEIYELASVGVVEEYRGNGIGKKIVEKLISAIPSNEVWITTIIPEFFEQFGFVEDENIPDEIILKCLRVCQKFHKTTRNSCYMCFRKEKFQQ